MVSVVDNHNELWNDSYTSQYSIRVTGMLTMKVGKVAAFAVGGGIIILQIAAHQGYIKVNWDKIQKKAEKIADKVEEEVTGEGPKLLDKVNT